MLLPLAGLCMDAAVNRFIIRERLGTKEIREQAFGELEKTEEEQISDNAGTDLIHRIRFLYIRHVLKNTDDEGMDPQAEIALYKILSLKDAENTEDVINVIDEIYNHVLDPSFEKRNGNLEKILNLPDMALANDAWQECMTDEQMEDIIQKYLSNLKKKMMSLDIKNKKKKRWLPKILGVAILLDGISILTTVLKYIKHSKNDGEKLQTTGRNCSNETAKS